VPSVKVAVRVTGPLVGPRQVARPFLDVSEELSIEMSLGSGLAQVGVAVMAQAGVAQPGEEVGVTTAWNLTWSPGAA